MSGAHAAPSRIQVLATSLRWPGVGRSIARTAGFNVASTAAAGLGGHHPGAYSSGRLCAASMRPSRRGSVSPSWSAIWASQQRCASTSPGIRERAREYVATSRAMMLTTGALALAAGMLLAPFSRTGCRGDARLPDRVRHLDRGVRRSQLHLLASGPGPAPVERGTGEPAGAQPDHDWFAVAAAAALPWTPRWSSSPRPCCCSLAGPTRCCRRTRLAPGRARCQHRPPARGVRRRPDRRPDACGPQRAAGPAGALADRVSRPTSAVTRSRSRSRRSRSPWSRRSATSHSRGWPRNARSPPPRTGMQRLAVLGQRRHGRGMLVPLAAGGVLAGAAGLRCRIPGRRAAAVDPDPRGCLPRLRAGRRRPVPGQESPDHRGMGAGAGGDLHGRRCSLPCCRSSAWRARRSPRRSPTASRLPRCSGAYGGCRSRLMAGEILRRPRGQPGSYRGHHVHVAPSRYRFPLGIVAADRGCRAGGFRFSELGELFL